MKALTAVLLVAVAALAWQAHRQDLALAEQRRQVEALGAKLAL